jgi:hypothetical protein
VWQRTKSPIHIYGTIRMGLSALTGHKCQNIRWRATRSTPIH